MIPSLTGPTSPTWSLPMPRLLTTLLPALLLTACNVAAADAPAQPRSTRAATSPTADHPVVLELYQSQGCSSCPPANANINALTQRADILALSFAVTYWDRLGWRDRFASPAFTERQWDYARANNRGSVWTPQLVINGRAETVTGRDRDDIDALVARAGRPRGGPAITLSPGIISLSAAPSRRPATVWLVHYDPREQAVPISAGENNGRTLPHRNIVRGLTRLGSWTGAAQRLTITAPSNPAWRSAVLVQSGTGGPIIAARRL
jgi:hypothetical protein